MKMHMPILGVVSRWLTVSYVICYEFVKIGKIGTGAWQAACQTCISPCRQAVPTSTTLPTPAVQGKCSTVSPLNYHWQHSISMKCNIRAPLYCTCFVAPLVHFACFNTAYNYCSVPSVWNKTKRRGHSGKCKCCISLFPDETVQTTHVGRQCRGSAALKIGLLPASYKLISRSSGDNLDPLT